MHRNKTGAKLAGVCAGLGDYFEVDPVLIRLIFVILCFWGGAGLILYIAAWIIIPEETTG
ncbi:MAG: PspC domain-containing protein [Candidatus Neomarinimicrobiota bacterium]